MCQLSLWSMTCKWSVKFSMIFFSLHPRSLNVPASFYFTSTRWYYQKLTTNFKVVDHISTFENNKNTKWSSSMSWIQFNQIWKTIEALSMKSRRRKKRSPLPISMVLNQRHRTTTIIRRHANHTRMKSQRQKKTK